MDQTILRQLTEVMCVLYTDKLSIRRILSDTGIDTSSLDLNRSLLNTWWAVIEELHKKNRVNALLTVVEAEYGSNLDFQAASKNYQQRIEPDQHRRQSFIKLREVLADLYQDTNTISRILTVSGVDPQLIDLSSSPINIWHSILLIAEQNDQINTLLLEVEAEFGMNPVFQNAANNYRLLVTQDNQEEQYKEKHVDLSGGKLADVSSSFWQRRDFVTLDLSSNQLQELPPGLVQLTQLTSLNLSSNQLYELSMILLNLYNLTELFLGSNSLATLPEDFINFGKLQRLFLGGNKLTALPEEIFYLHRLEELELNDNQLTALPHSISKLLLEALHLRGNKITEINTIVEIQSLRLLDLDSNQLTELPSELDQLRNLSILRLRGNRLSQVPRSFSKLRNLTILDIRRNLFQRFPAAITHLPELQTLLASDNKITTLPSDFSRLSMLKRLELANNQLKSLPTAITGLTKLTQLDLSGNQLTSLPDDIDRWSDLEELNLNGNHLSSLPVKLTMLTRLRRLDLRDNLLPIPAEILSQVDDPSAIIAYYMNHHTSQRQPLNEAKMLVVGQGSVGKTTLIRLLTGGDFRENEPTTPGIEVKQWPITLNDKTIQVNIWDFAGQEIKHATHQFFLTRRSLYLLVFNVREDERANRLEYWLKLIQSFGGNSPVIIAANKVDENQPDINMSGLQAKYPNIRGFIPTSCLNNKGIRELEQLIRQEISQLEHVQSEILVNWFAVKQKLETMNDVDYLPYTEYLELCRSSSINDAASQRALLELLHQLGVVLCYQEDPRLQDTNILNPEWVTNGVYTILNSNLLFQQRGILERQQLTEILDPVRYPPDKHSFLLDLMRKFELCFDLDGHIDQKFLVPDLLYWEDLDTGHWADALPFRYDYDVLPGSIITRFIVKMHPYIRQHTVWRTGVVLTHEDNRALIRGDIEDRRIYIWVDGPIHGRRNFLSNIRFQFDSIHKTIPGIKAAEKVPLPQHPGIVVDYRHLLRLERLNEETFIPEGLSERVSVRTLLDGIVPEEERRSERVDVQIEGASHAQTTGTSAPAETSNGRSSSQELWYRGLFFLLVFVVVIVTLVFAANYTDSYALPIILITALLAIPLIGVLQAFNDGTLTEKGFLQVVVETFQRLPLLRGRSDPSSGEN